MDPLHSSSSSSNSNTSSSSSLGYYYRDFWLSIGHPSSAGFPFIREGPWTLVLLSIGYLLIATVFGPRWMKSRPAFQLKHYELVYNGFVFGVFGVGAPVFLAFTDLGGLMLTCDLLQGIRFYMWVHTAYTYVAMRVLLFMDTGFLVLNKRFEQITALHLFERLGSVFKIYADFIVFPGGVSGFGPAVDCIVQILLRAVRTQQCATESIRPAKHWERTLDAVRFIQYTAIGLHSVYSLGIVGCPVPVYIRLQSLAFGALLAVCYARRFIRGGGGDRSCSDKGSSVDQNCNALEGRKTK